MLEDDARAHADGDVGLDSERDHHAAGRVREQRGDGGRRSAALPRPLPDVEAAHRPVGVPRVEDVFAAYKKAGVDVHDEKQHLGAPFLAQYCVGFEAGVDIHGSVCEHKDEATAIKGRDASDKGFMAVPNRKVYRNGGSTLILREGVVSPPNDALVKKMVATFQAQKPSAGPPPVGSAPSPFAGASAAPMPSDQPLP